MAELYTFSRVKYMFAVKCSTLNQFYAANYLDDAHIEVAYETQVLRKNLNSMRVKLSIAPVGSFCVLLQGAQTEVCATRG